MKIGGKVIDGPKKGLLVIPRESGDIAFHFVGISDDSDYDRMNPQPKPQRKKNIKTGKTFEDVDDKAFQEKLSAWRTAKFNWFFLKSIEPSQIEWTSVNMSDPSTYGNWNKDLKDAGFTVGECNLIYNKFQEVNLLTEELLNEARDRFLASQEATPSPETQ